MPQCVITTQVINKSLISLRTITSNTVNRLSSININTKKTRHLHVKGKVTLGSLRNLRVDPGMNISLLVSIIKNNLQHELNLILRRKFDEVNEVLKINYMMVELCIE